MTEDSGGGGAWAFGSRFSDLSLDQQELDWTTKRSNRGNHGKKRTANRVTQNENQFTKLLRVDNNNGPRFLILQRTDENQTMKTVSPFFIRKAMDSITPNVAISRTREGGLLLKTVDKQQAEKLLKQKVFGGTVNIKITEHETLNKSRGTIFCPDLKMHTDKEITDELKHEHVTEVKRVKRRNRKGELEDSGVFILTFNLGNLPRSIDAGFHSCRVQQYVPPPLRCMNCLKFGHKKLACKGNQICASCANLYHDKNQCQQGLKCVVCRGDHHALSKECPVYQDELEIQRMKVTEKISYREARQKRRLQAPDPNPPRLRQTFASLFTKQTKPSTSTMEHPQNNAPSDHPNEEPNTETYQGNSPNHQPTQTSPADDSTTGSTQMNLTNTNSVIENDELTPIPTTNTETNLNDEHIQQKITETTNEPQQIPFNDSTNTTNTSNEFKMIPDNTNMTNTMTESNNLFTLSQFIAQSININEEDMNDNEL